ncbi:hypothetical protein CEXT_740201 [Caerostris extrusa]|uniref:Uncharacterized protein n=1 Tax=Caerostris extrusa TaxID=172846 RepID=A0AAV4X9Q9_CAEEX|nr:hypothetical protein CEXT_740201 [Caerostris extrusa]
MDVEPVIRKMDVEEHQRIRPTTHRYEKKSRRRIKGAVTQNSAPPDKGIDRVVHPCEPRGEREPCRIINPSHQ